MKTAIEILHNLPVSTIIHLKNKEIAEMFGLQKSTVSTILSDKFKVSKFKNEDIIYLSGEMDLKTEGAWMNSEERKLIKQKTWK